MKKALITGITGQDGAYLSKFLLDKGYVVYGTYRRTSTTNFWRLQYLNVLDKIKLIPADLTDSNSIYESIKISMPDEIYNLAAQSFVAASFSEPTLTSNINGIGVTNILEAIRMIDDNIKLYQASTSELYGRTQENPQTENTPFYPQSPYAVSKLYGYWMTKIYREGYNLFACNGILFNHESPLRGLEFVTRKISNSVAKIALNLQNKLVMGDINTKRDWGYAPDYVESMWLMLQHEIPDDYVIATGETHSVEEFIVKAFDIVNLDYTKYLVTDDKYKRILDVQSLTGDYTKAENILGWKPKVTFDKLVKIMVKEDLIRWTNAINGKIFSHGSPNNVDETNIINRTITP